MAKYNRQRRPQSTQATSSASTRAQSATGSTTTSASSSRLNDIRSRTAASRPPVNRYRYARQPWWRRNLIALASGAAVVLVIIGFIFYAQAQNKAAAVGIGDAAPHSIMSQLSGVSAKTASTVGTGGLQDTFEPTPPNVPPLTSKGLPEIVYVGAEYCPYCAADRWSTIIALDRFGSFNGVTLMKSSSSDVFPNTSTFSFRNATYTSKYIVFNATETQDRNNGALGTPSTEAMAALATYDAPPYTNQSGGIPFMSYANQWVTTVSPYDPTVLKDLSWQQIAAQLNNPNSAATKSIIGTANYQTAAICKLTNNQPASVCSEPYIKSIEAALPSR
ncbi:MAG TPA: DUF929 family protein [Ktedonobacterales bacterium]